MSDRPVTPMLSRCLPLPPLTLHVALRRLRPGDGGAPAWTGLAACAWRAGGTDRVLALLWAVRGHRVALRVRQERRDPRLRPLQDGVRLPRVPRPRRT